MNNDANIYVTLKDLADVSAGYPLRGAADKLEQGVVRLIQLRNVDQTEGVKWCEVARVELPSKREPKWLQKGDIIFTSRGAKTLAYHLSDVPEKTVCAPQFFVVRLKDYGTAIPSFLAWQINQKSAQDYLLRNATGSGMLSIRREVLEDLPLRLPSLQKQKMIVDFWSAAMNEKMILNQLIENRNRQLEALAFGIAQ